MNQMKVEISKKKKEVEETGEDEEWMDVEDDDEEF